MPTKKYRFDFYLCDTRSANANSPAITTEIVLRQFHSDYDNPEKNTIKKIGRINYEIRHIEETDFGFRGVIGKYRANDLPHAAELGGAERELELNPNEGLLEKSHFHFYADYSLLILQRNHFCIGWNAFRKYLSPAGYSTALDPIIESQDLGWLLDNTIQVRTAKINIARPTNPEIYQGIQHDFNNAIFAGLGASGSAAINLSLRGDARATAPEERYLSNGFKRALIEMQEVFEVKNCQLLLENTDTHVEHPVDLVADRLTYEKEINVEGRYPSSPLMWDALQEAREGNDEELLNYFGDLHRARIA